MSIEPVEIGHANRRALQFAMANTGFPQMRVNQLVLLLLVSEFPGISQKELQERDFLNCSPGGVSRNIDVFGTGNVRGKSERHKFAGFVEVRPGQCDDRTKHVYLTKKGESFIESFLGFTTGLSES